MAGSTCCARDVCPDARQIGAGMKILIVTVLMLTMVGAYPLSAEQLDQHEPRFIEIRDATVIPYFLAMQEGDVGSMKTYLSARRYAINRQLIERNRDYPDHLRQHLKDAGFELVSLGESQGRYSASVRIYWPNGEEAISVLELVEDKRAQPGGIRWKIDRD